MKIIRKFEIVREPENISRDPIQRLKYAVLGMEEGVKNQRKNIASLRANVSELKKEMKALDKTMGDYRTCLGRINVLSLRGKSLRLSQIMGSYLDAHNEKA